ncbi:hypothetical protein RDI58_026017 [Solanum bulbocastanum]|uniref:ADP-ribosyl cyclase/cyclic ADP-ribose hydrolase n=1 Tax=Solanum bulbocastanum TaxID=147425 RepID=A0AAN8Y0R3_SOLBU
MGALGYILSKLFGEKDNCVNDKEVGRSMLAKKLQLKKILVVLDDIDHRDQLEYLAKDLSWFGKGSRIIATTRDKRLIGENDVVFEVETLLDRDAIKLFNQYAFKEKVPNKRFKNLTLEIVSLAKGHPLALKVWGSSLHRMDIIEWESALVRIKKNSDVEITENLKISYDGKLIRLDLSYCESLERFPYVNGESLEFLNLKYCSSLEKFPEFLGIMKPELKIKMSYSGIRELPLSFFDLQPHLRVLHLSLMENLVSLPSSICKSKGLVRIDVSNCSKLESLPEEIGDLENLKELDAIYTLISRPPSSIVDEGLCSLEYLDLSYCNIIDGGLPEDIGSLSSLEVLKLRGNNFEHLPRSIAQLGALQTLDLSKCRRLKAFLGFRMAEGLCSLEELDLSYCNIIDGGLPEDIGSLSSLKELKLGGNNFEHLPRSIAQLGALQTLDLSHCMRLTQLPEFPQQLHTIAADWSNDSICNSLFQNISSLQHDICTSDSLSLRVFTTEEGNISRWFHHREDGTSIFVKLPKNWYVSEKFLGFAVCFSGQFIDGIAHLFSYQGRRVTCIAQKFALSIHSEYHVLPAIHFFLVPLTGLLDKLKANGKTPNDYGCIKLTFSEEVKKCGVRLLYKHHDSVTRICRIL